MVINIYLFSLSSIKKGTFAIPNLGKKKPTEVWAKKRHIMEMK